MLVKIAPETIDIPRGPCIAAERVAGPPREAHAADQLAAVFVDRPCDIQNRRHGSGGVGHSAVPRVEMSRHENEVRRRAGHVGDDDGDRAPAAIDLGQEPHRDRSARCGSFQPLAIRVGNREKRNRRHPRGAVGRRRSPDGRHDVFVQRVGRVHLNDRERPAALAGKHQRLGIGHTVHERNAAADLRSEGDRLIGTPRHRRINDQPPFEPALRRCCGERGGLARDSRAVGQRQIGAAGPAEKEPGLMSRVRDAVLGQLAIEIGGAAALAFAPRCPIDVDRVQRPFDLRRRYLGLDGVQSCLINCGRRRCRQRRHHKNRFHRVEIILRERSIQGPGRDAREVNDMRPAGCRRE